MSVGGQQGAAPRGDGVIVLQVMRGADGALTDAVVAFQDLGAAGRDATVGDIDGPATLRRHLPRLAAVLWEPIQEADRLGSPRTLAGAWEGEAGPWGAATITPLGDGRLIVALHRATPPAEDDAAAALQLDPRVRDALDRTPDTITILRPILGEDGRLADVEAVFMNQAGLDRWYGGRTFEEMAGVHLFEAQPIAGAYVRDLYREVWETGVSFDGTRRYDTPTGVLWADIHVARTPGGLVHTSRNVTEARLAEEALSRSLHGLEEAQRVGQLGSFELDEALEVVACSDEYIRLLGFDPADGVPSREARGARFDEADARLFRARVARIARDGNGSYEQAAWVHLPDGTQRCLLFRIGVAEHGGDGARLRGTATDITELRIAQEQALAAQERLAAVAGAVAEAIALVHPVRADGLIVEMRATWANAAWLDREGLQALAPAGIDVLSLHPEYGAMLPQVEQVMATGVPHQFEGRMANGRWLAISFSRLKDDFLVASLDVTERRRAQELTSDRLRLALEGATDAVSITDGDGRLVYVNRAFESISGVSRVDALGQVPAILGTPASPSEVATQLRQGTPYHGVVERTRPDGGRTSWRPTSAR